MKTTRYIAKCRVGSHTSTLTSNMGLASADMGALFYDKAGESGTFDALVMRCRSCKKARRAMAVVGKISKLHVCNDKCETSTSGKCECSCGGKNHGGAYSAA